MMNTSSFFHGKYDFIAYQILFELFTIIHNNYAFRQSYSGVWWVSVRPTELLVLIVSPQTHHVYSTLKRRGNGRFNVEHRWCVCRYYYGINRL